MTGISSARKYAMTSCTMTDQMNGVGSFPLISSRVLPIPASHCLDSAMYQPAPIAQLTMVATMMAIQLTAK